MSLQEDKSNDKKEAKNNQQMTQETFTYPTLTKLLDFQPVHDYIFRICLLGDSSVGKTSLLTQYCENIFKPKYCNTIGVDFKVVTLQYKNLIAKVHIWDTAGQERFKSIAINYFRSSNGFIFVYDITSDSSFKNANNWIELAVANNKTAVVFFLVGNKSDLANERTVSTQQGEDLARKGNYIFFETSALNASNVDRMFEYVTYKLIEYYTNNKSACNLNESHDSKISTDNAKTIDTNKAKTDSKCKC